MTAQYRRDRRQLVERLRQSGIQDLAVLHAFDEVPRHRFVPEAVRHRAYEIAALPIGHEQTISRPTVHATHLSLAQLEGDERVLEVGTGSGFQTALLALLADEVYSIERVDPLAERARDRLRQMEVEGVHVRTGDGSRGWPGAAPFDVILVGAAAPSVPSALEEQLAEGGRLVVPVGDDEQRLLLIRRRGGELEREEVERSRFVPLVGEEGW
ncbi:MAG: protein-L-isoaspartate(D-aspartate) O-methyltransferase [Candidatus Palauibacterales bacterium]|nr:protein-L-isoaspartate(D-aspartate) O-methyltransferase [Candidatus Palauibacterales bacterium]